MAKHKKREFYLGLVLSLFLVLVLSFFLGQQKQYSLTGSVIGLLPVEGSNESNYSETIGLGDAPDNSTENSLPEIIAITPSDQPSPGQQPPFPDLSNDSTLSTGITIQASEPAAESSRQIQDFSVLDSSVITNLSSGTEVVRYNKKFSNYSNIIISSPTKIDCSIPPDNGDGYSRCTTYFDVENFNALKPTIPLPNISLKFTNGNITATTFNFSNRYRTTWTDPINGTYENESFTYQNISAREFYNYTVMPTLLDTALPFSIKVAFNSPRFTENNFNFSIAGIGFNTLLDPAVTACGTADAAGVYTLSNNITSATTCITINTNHILLDCAGFNITYATGGGTSQFGVNDSGGYDNITIQNCIILEGSAGGSSNHGINLQGTVENSTVFNNRIKTVTTSSRGVNLGTTTTKINVSYNSIILPQSDGILCNTCTNSMFDQNVINMTSASIIAYPITLTSPSTNINITNNIINTVATSAVTPGIRIRAGSNFAYVFNNTIASKQEGLTIDSVLGLNLSYNLINSTSGNPFSIQGNIPEHFNHTMVGNMAHGLPIAYNSTMYNRVLWEHQNLTNVYGAVMCGWCSGVNITNITINNDGVRFYNVTDSNIVLVNTSSASVAGGINLDFSNNNRIFNNSVNGTIGAGDTTTKGMINIHHGSNNNYIANNTVFAGQFNKFAILVDNSSNNTITMNTLGAFSSSGNSAGGINLQSGSQGNIISRNNISMDGTALTTGITISTNSTIVRYNIINDTQGSCIRINANAGENMFISNNLSAQISEILDISTISAINYLIYNTSYGRIEWFNNGSGSSLENISIASSNDGFGLDAGVVIRNNTIAFNTSSIPFSRLNETANITLVGLAFGNVTTVSKTPSFQTDNTTIITTGTSCVGSGCTYLTYDNSTGTFKFSSTSLGSFAANGSYISSTLCSSVSSDTNLTNDLYAQGTCFTINANNIQIDCLGFNITYGQGGTTGYAIDNNGFDNITIKNCEFMEGNNNGNSKFAIYYYGGAENGTITNNTLRMNGTSSYGIALNNSNGNMVSNNTVDTLGDLGTGIYLEASDDVQVANNTLKAAGVSAHGIDITTSSDRAIVRRNEIRTIKSHGIVLNISLNDSILRSNNVTSAGNSIFLQTSVNRTLLINNNLTSTAGSEISDDSGGAYVNYLIYNNSFGEIKWIHDNESGSFLRDMEVDGDGVTGLGVGKSIFINNNSVAFNISAYALATSKINSSANVTFFALDDIVTRNRILRVENATLVAADILDAGTNCNGTSCSILSYANGILIFNTTGFSSFASKNNSLPAAPVLNSPTNISTITTATPILNWTNSVDADRDILTYHLQVDDNSDFSSPEVNASSIAEGSSGLTGFNLTTNSLLTLVTGTNYSWHVRAFDRFDFGNFSITNTFRVEVVPAAEPAASADLARGPTGGGSSSSSAKTVSPTSEVIDGQVVKTVSEAIAAGESIYIPVEDAEIGVESVSFTAKDDLNVKVTILPRTVESVPLLPPTTVYKYFEIKMENVPAAEIKDAVITFVVAEDWLTEQNIAPEEMILLRLEGEQWVPYATKFLTSRNNFYHFETAVPGFSVFAIAVKSPALPEVQEPEVIPSKDQRYIILAVILLVAIPLFLIVFLITVIVRRRRAKAVLKK